MYQLFKPLHSCKLTVNNLEYVTTIFVFLYMTVFLWPTCLTVLRFERY